MLLWFTGMKGMEGISVLIATRMRHPWGIPMRTLPICFVLVLAPLQAQGPEVRSTAKDRTALSVTIYRNNLTAIRDTRRVALPAGPSRLAFADLVPTLRPKSATLLDPGGGIQVRERNYEFNLLSPASLVDASLGQTVRVRGEEGRAEQEGTLASLPLLRPRMRGDARPLDRIAKRPSAFAQHPDPDVVVATPQGLQSRAPAHLAFSQLPPQLRASPTLLQDLVAEAPGPRDLTLLYTATDLSWTAHYVATLDMDGKHLDLDVFATVKNQSGSELREATLQLLAGEPNVVYDPPPSDPNATWVDQTALATVEVCAAPIAPPAFKEEKLTEFPLFTLDRPVTLAGRSDKQLKLFGAARVPITRTLLIEASYQDYGASPSTVMGSTLFQTEPAAIGYSPVPRIKHIHDFAAGPADTIPDSSMAPILQKLEHQSWVDCHHPAVLALGSFANTGSSRLGRALPKGSLLLRYQDPSGSLVLLGGPQGQEAEFPQTPAGEEVELRLGPVTGFRVARRGTFQKRLPAKAFKDEQGRIHPQRRYEYGVEVQIQTDLDSAALITVREPLTAGWELTSSSHRGKRSGSDAYDFPVRVPAHGQATLRYTVRTDLERWATE
jgi:hypothetical protein